MPVRDRDRWQGFSTEFAGRDHERGVIVAAERRTLEELKRSASPAQRQSASGDTKASGPESQDRSTGDEQDRLSFGPTTAALAVIAQLLVYLTRMQAVRRRSRTVLMVDFAVLGLGGFAGVFTIGWIAANGFARVPPLVVVVIGSVLVVSTGRGVVLVVQAARFRRTGRLRRQSRKIGTRHAIDDFFRRESLRLGGWRHRARRAVLPHLETRLDDETRRLNELSRRVSRLSDADLRFAFEAELENQDDIPQTHYARDLLGGKLGRMRDPSVWATTFEHLTGLPLTPSTARRLAAYRVEARLGDVVDALLHQAGAHSGGDR